MGNVLQAGVGQTPARQAALMAGLPDTIAAVTVNKVCGSGLKAVMLAAQAIRAGDADLIVAGGMESMSRAPHLLMGARQAGSTATRRRRRHDPRRPVVRLRELAMGEAAEHIADEVRRRAAPTRTASPPRATSGPRPRGTQGAFKAEVVPVTVGSGAEGQDRHADEGIRPDTTAEGLAKLQPAFRADGTVTAGNASHAQRRRRRPSWSARREPGRAGREAAGPHRRLRHQRRRPKDIFIAPVTAVQQACGEGRSSTLEDIDLFEMNEAFAAQMLACQRALKLDEARVNVHGGGIALGHPIGASGAQGAGDAGSHPARPTSGTASRRCAWAAATRWR